MRLKQITDGPVIDRTLAIIDGLLIFPGSDAEHGVELWRSDGTPAGTGVLKDINPETASSYPAFLRNVNGRVVFQACDTSGCRPWVSDGTESGTRQLADVASSGPFEPAGSLLFFAASDRFNGDELWAVPLAAIAPCEDCTATPTPPSTPTRTIAPPSATVTQPVTTTASPTHDPTSTQRPSATPVARRSGGCAIADANGDAGWGLAAVLLAPALLRRRRR